MPKYRVTVVFEADNLVDAVSEVLYPAGEQTTLSLIDIYANKEL